MTPEEAEPNLRNALPHAAFIGFTGTPLLAAAAQESNENGK